MSCGTSEVFMLLIGSALLPLAAMYFFSQNQKADLDHKYSRLNAALSSLQEERAALNLKADKIFSDNASQRGLITFLTQELKTLHNSVERLEADKEEILSEYSHLKSTASESTREMITRIYLTPTKDSNTMSL